MLPMQITKTIESCTKCNNCNQVTNGKHIKSSPFQDFPKGINLCNRSYELSARSEPPIIRQCVVTPGNIISNICSKIKWLYKFGEGFVGMKMKLIHLKDICDLDNGYAFKSNDYVENSNTLNCRMSNIRPDGSFDIMYNAKYLILNVFYYCK